MDHQLEHGRRDVALDGVRGIACLLVLLHHCGRGPGVSAAAKIFNRISAAGWVGVDLFFVLSGFLITGLLLEGRGRPGGLRRFWSRRALRILPLAYLFMALVFLSPIWRGEAWHPALASEQAWFWSYTNNWLALARPSLDHGVLGHFWSLAIEEQFYLVWPIVTMLLAPRQLGRLCLLILCASLAGHLVAAAHGAGTDVVCSLTPARLDGLMAGAWLATRAHTRDPPTPARRSHWALLLASGMLAVVLIAVTGGLRAGNRLVLSIGFSALALIFALFIAGLMSAPDGAAVRRLCGARPLASLGRISYGFYVLHVPAVAFLRKNWAPTGTFGDCLGFLAAALLGSALLATVSWFAFERPLLRLRPRPVTGGDIHEHETQPGEVRGGRWQFPAGLRLRRE
ncbi:MAG TPA: acyltransferase [Polyangia bacterium]|nr:acyltransferase [Polyangia bacterium]